MSEIDVPGPVDFVLIEFPGDRPLAPAADALLGLIDRGLVTLFDLAIVRKEADGSFSGMDLDVADGAFVAFEGARTGMLTDDDLRQAADAMEPGTVAALLVYENTWARPFVAAAMEAGGVMIASERIPVVDVMAALDALEAQD
ncbi:MAG: DUF1269 domain-containing protein [Actinobacteria bacterium]|nr:DUF1269 domain-containing protein [Actinomycetota bacterium]